MTLWCVGQDVDTEVFGVLIAVNSSWSIADTDSVLCALEGCAVLLSLWNISLMPPWQCRL